MKEKRRLTIIRDCCCQEVVGETADWIFSLSGERKEPLICWCRRDVRRWWKGGRHGKRPDGEGRKERKGGFGLCILTKSFVISEELLDWRRRSLSLSVRLLAAVGELTSGRNKNGNICRDRTREREEHSFKRRTCACASSHAETHSHLNAITIPHLFPSLVKRIVSNYSSKKFDPLHSKHEQECALRFLSPPSWETESSPLISLRTTNQMRRRTSAALSPTLILFLIFISSLILLMTSYNIHSLIELLPVFYWWEWDAF